MLTIFFQVLQLRLVFVIIDVDREDDVLANLELVEFFTEAVGIL